MNIGTAAWWGFLGAVVYAAPRLLVAVSQRQPGTRAWLPFAEFVVALIIGPIGAGGLVEFLAGAVHLTSLPDERAVALVVGMIANPMAPTVVQLVGTGVARRLGGTSMRKPGSR